MPRHEIVSVVADNVVQLTNSDAVTVSLQNLGGYVIGIFATVDDTPPDPSAAKIEILPNQILAGVSMAELFPGLAAPTRLWVSAVNGGRVSISHD